MHRHSTLVLSRADCQVRDLGFASTSGSRPRASRGLARAHGAHGNKAWAGLGREPRLPGPRDVDHTRSLCLTPVSAPCFLRCPRWIRLRASLLRLGRRSPISKEQPVRVDCLTLIRASPWLEEQRPSPQFTRARKAQQPPPQGSLGCGYARRSHEARPAQSLGPTFVRCVGRSPRDRATRRAAGREARSGGSTARRCVCTLLLRDPMSHTHPTRIPRSSPARTS